jgi:hypothetical protein
LSLGECFGDVIDGISDLYCEVGADKVEPLDDFINLISNVLTDYLSRYGSTGHQRPDRPSSAKRRSPLSTGTYDSGISLGDTLRPGQGNRFMKSSRGSTLSAPTSQYKSEMPSITLEIKSFFINTVLTLQDIYSTLRKTFILMYSETGLR